MSKRIKLIPQLEGAIPAGGQEFAGLVRVPEDVYADILVGLEGVQQLGRLPVPDEDLPVRVPGDQVGHVGREVGRAGVPGHHVAREDLLGVHLEAVHADKGLDLVVHGLAGEPLAVGGGRDGGHGVHRRVRDVLDVHRDVPLPDSQTLVVRGAHEAPVVVHEGDAVDGAQVAVVLLDDVPTPSVPAEDLLGNFCFVHFFTHSTVSRFEAENVVISEMKE